MLLFALKAIRESKIFTPLLTALILIGIFFVCAVWAYPVFIGDSSYYIPPAINLKGGRGLINQVSGISTQVDPSGEARFIYYPPLFQFVLSYLMPFANPWGASLAIALMNACVIMGLVVLFFRYARCFLFIDSILVSIAFFGLATSFAPFEGRPEILARVIFVFGLLAVTFIQYRIYRMGVLGVLLGCMGATVPGGGVLFFILITLYILATTNVRRGAFEMFNVIGVSLVVFFLVLSFSPYGAGETLTGILTHAKILAESDADRTVGRMIAHTMWYPQTTLYGVLFLIFVICTLILVRVFWKRICSKKSFLFILSLFFLLCAGLIRLSFESYVFLFSPLFFIVILFARQLNKKPLILCGVAILFLLTSIGFLRTHVLFIDFMKNGVSLSQARSHFQFIMTRDANPIMVSPALWVLSDDYDILSGARRSVASIPRTVLVQQAYSSRTKPPVMPRCSLIENHFSAVVPELFGVPIAHTTPGYGFAAYHCE